MNLPRKAHAVIFDMDGLIVDTEPLYRDAIMAAAGDGGHDMPLAFYLSMIGLSGEAAHCSTSDLAKGLISAASGQGRQSGFGN